MCCAEFLERGGNVYETLCPSELYREHSNRFIVVVTIILVCFIFIQKFLPKMVDV